MVRVVNDNLASARVHLDRYRFADDAGLRRAYLIAAQLRLETAIHGLKQVITELRKEAASGDQS